jgi:methylphosphotriester-DNA--protein-cysteine methyltransferase
MAALCRVSARTGTTATTLLTTIRMMVAADLLTRSDRSVSRVAGEAGTGLLAGVPDRAGHLVRAVPQAGAMTQVRRR